MHSGFVICLWIMPPSDAWGDCQCPRLYVLWAGGRGGTSPKRNTSPKSQAHNENKMHAKLHSASAHSPAAEE